MMIDGKNYGNTAVKITIISTFMISKALTRALEGLVYYKEDIGKQQGLNHTISFYAQNPGIQTVLHGNHTIEFNNKNDKGFMLECMDYSKIRSLLKRAITAVPSLLLNASQPECAVTFFDDDNNIAFNSTVIGVNSTDCETYSDLYQSTANQCSNKLDEYNQTAIAVVLLLVVLIFCLSSMLNFGGQKNSPTSARFTPSFISSSTVFPLDEGRPHSSAVYPLAQTQAQPATSLSNNV